MPAQSYVPQAQLEITTSEQISAFSHATRQKILRVLVQRPCTNKQVADALGETPPRIYHHIRELERAGLIKLVYTAPHGSVIEKYYAAVALRFKLVADFSAMPEQAAVASSALVAAEEDLQTAVTQHPNQHVHIRILHESTWLNPDERRTVEDLIGQLGEIMQKSIQSGPQHSNAKPLSLLVLAHYPAD